MRRRIALVIVCGALAVPGIAARSAQARAVRVTVSALPRGLPAAALVVRGADGSVATATLLRGARATVGVPTGASVVRVVAGARQGVGLVGRRTRAVRIRLRGRAAARATSATARATTPAHAAAGGAAPIAPGSIVAADPIVLRPGAGSPQTTPVSVDAQLLTELFRRWSGQGVRFVDTSPRVRQAIAVEEKLARDGQLDSPFTSHPLTPDYVLRGSGTMGADGTVGLDVKLVAPDGAIVAVWHTVQAPPKGRRGRRLGGIGRIGAALQTALDAAAGGLEADATPQAGALEPSRPPAPPPSGIAVTASGVFFGNRWGAGTVTDGAGHSVANGYTSVAHGSFGGYAAGQQVTLTATPSRGSLFDHWEGACSGTQPTCGLVAGPNQAVTAFFAPQIVTITIVNTDPSRGSVFGTNIGCGTTYTDCSKREVAASNDNQVEYVSADAVQGATFVSFDGCDAWASTGPRSGTCTFLPSVDRTITVHWG